MFRALFRRREPDQTAYLEAALANADRRVDDLIASLSRAEEIRRYQEQQIAALKERLAQNGAAA
jgi:hypothetical protein